MRILHFISNYSTSAGPVIKYVQQMISSTSRMAETHLLTCTQLSAEYCSSLMEQKGIRVHHLRKQDLRNPMQILATRHHINKVLKEVHPDIVHVHGSWDYLPALVEQTARHAGYITIVSPHRGLSPAIIGIEFWKKKLLRLLAYQLWMVFKCVSIIAVNEQEAKDIRSSGLKKRIEVLSERPVGQEAQTSPLTGDFGGILLASYRKALDSMYYRTLTKEEKDFVFAMVKSVTVDDDVIVEQPAVEGVSYRRIFFHAYDEDVMDMMLQGVQKMGVTIPPTPDIAGIPRYKNRKAKQRGSLADVQMQSYKVSIPEDYKAERDAVSMILKARNLTFERLTLRHLVELYDLFRHNDFNEDIVMNELMRIRCKGYTKKLQKYLHNLFALKDGYDIF